MPPLRHASPSSTSPAPSASRPRPCPSSQRPRPRPRHQPGYPSSPSSKRPSASATDPTAPPAISAAAARNVISLLVQALDNPCFVDIAVAARAAAEKRGYEVNVVGAGPVDAELRALDRLHDEGSDGVIVATGRHGTRPAALDLLRGLVSRGLQAVVLLDRSPEPRVPAIRVDVEARCPTGGGAPVAARAIAALRTWRCTGPVPFRRSCPRKATAIAATALRFGRRHRSATRSGSCAAQTRSPVDMP